MDMRRMMTLGAVAMLAVVVGATGEAATTKKKVKGQRAPAVSGAAGAVSSARATFTPRAIEGSVFQGVYCTGTTPNVHDLGTVPAGTGIIIDFDSDDNADPIAILTTLKTDGLDIGAENQGSDDDGGDLNPRFVVRRPYRATYVLTVASADDDEACYGYSMKFVP